MAEVYVSFCLSMSCDFRDANDSDFLAFGLILESVREDVSSILAIDIDRTGFFIIEECHQNRAAFLVGTVHGEECGAVALAMAEVDDFEAGIQRGRLHG